MYYLLNYCKMDVTLKQTDAFLIMKNNGDLLANYLHGKVIVDVEMLCKDNMYPVTEIIDRCPVRIIELYIYIRNCIVTNHIYRLSRLKVSIIQFTN